METIPQEIILALSWAITFIIFIIIYVSVFVRATKLPVVLIECIHEA